MPIQGVVITLVSDINNNGVLDVSEATQTTVTDANGNYSFTDLDAGTYLVIEDQPTGLISVQDGDISNDGDLYDSTFNVDNIVFVTLINGETDSDNNFIEAVPTGSISGIVAEDRDGGAPSIDAPIENVTVKLYRDLNNDGIAQPSEYVTSTTSDPFGVYTFEDVVPGNYLIVEEQPVGFYDVQDGDRSTDGDSTDGIYNTDNIILAIVEPGEADSDNDFIETLPGSIAGIVAEDTDGGSLSFDNPLEGVLITLVKDLNGNGIADIDEPITTKTTDQNGAYSFENLVPGDYIVIEKQPFGLASISDKDESPDGDPSDSDATVDNIILAPVLPGEADTENNFAEQASTPGTISGNVSLDTDGGSASADEPIENVVIKLYKDLIGDGIVVSGNLYESTTTDEYGNYEFTNVPTGDYIVVEEQPADLFDVQDGDESNDGDATDGVYDTNNEILVTLTDSETDADNNFIELEPGSITGSVFEDNNGGGLSFDNPIQNVEIVLVKDLNSNGVRDAGEPVLIDSTDASGIFSFSNLEPGDYILLETQPRGFTSIQDGDYYPDGDAQDGTFDNNDVILVTVETGEVDAENRFVEKKSTNGSISGVVAEDTNAGTPSKDSPISGVTIKLYADINNDGIPQTSELVATEQTGSDGAYTFTDRETGAYIVVQEQPAGFADVQDGDESNDGDVLDGVYNTDNQILVKLTSAEQDDDNNFIEEVLAAIAGNVSLDTDGGEATADQPIQSVSITLVEDLNNNGEQDAGEPTQSTTTDIDGNYKFESLLPGNYIVIESQPSGLLEVRDGDESDDGDATDVTFNTDNQIIVNLERAELDADNNFIEGQPGAISGYVSEDTDGGTASADQPIEGVQLTLVSDLNNNGILDAGEAVQTTTTNASGYYEFTNLTPGDYIVIETQPLGYTTVRDGDESDDGDATDVTFNTDDFILATIELGETDADNNFIENVISGSISGVVAQDANGGTVSKDILLENVTISLYDDANNDGVADVSELVTSTTTNANGAYSFTNLAPGNYIVVEEQPANLISVVDGDESSDGDAFDADQTADNQIRVYVNSNEADTDNNFIEAIASSIAGNVSVDTDGGIESADLPLAGVEIVLVKDLNNNQLQDLGEPVWKDTTDVDGNYSFENVVPGKYIVFETQPVGYTSVIDGDLSYDDDFFDNVFNADDKIEVTTRPGEDDTDNDFIEEDFSVRIAGNVFNDGNGLTDATVNGTPINNPSDEPLYVNLIDDATGLVVATVPVNEDGTYLFEVAEQNKTYNLQLTTNQGVIGVTPPATALPSLWVPTGENQGADPGSDGDVNQLLQVTVTTVDVDELNFGIDSLPDSNIDSFYLDPSPKFHDVRDLVAADGMGPIGGFDKEDGTYGTGDIYIITDTSKMNGNILFYDVNDDQVFDASEQLVPGDTIFNYNPDLLSVKFSGDKSDNFMFEYVTVDEAGFKDLTPGTYTVSWPDPVPVTLISFNAELMGVKDVLLTWSTASELNNDRFEIERRMENET